MRGKELPSMIWEWEVKAIFASAGPCTTWPFPYAKYQGLVRQCAASLRHPGHGGTGAEQQPCLAQLPPRWIAAPTGYIELIEAGDSLQGQKR